ncbi:MAG: hypothetical protein RL516_831 [Bacteroidota bacterium]|jgi:hypothetical protein
MLTLKCSCGEKYLADEIHIGKKIICKKCRKVIEIARPFNAQNNSQADIPLYTPPPKAAYSNSDYTKKQSNAHNASGGSTFKDDTKKLWPFLIILLIALIAYCNKKSSDSTPTENSSNLEYNQPETGSLFVKDSSNTTDSIDTLSSSNDNSLETPFDYSNLKPIKEFKKIEPESNNVIRKEERKEYEFWDKPNLLTGQTPCYNFVPTYDYDSKNSIEIKVGRNADVAVKLYNYYTDECIRYVYIRRGASYTMNKLPSGKYYTKIGYGLNWRDTINNGQCVGMFEIYDSYEKSSDIIDLYKIKNTNYIEFGQLIIYLDLTVNRKGTEDFNTSRISRDEFNR